MISPCLLTHTEIHFIHSLRRCLHNGLYNFCYFLGFWERVCLWKSPLLHNIPIIGRSENEHFIIWTVLILNSYILFNEYKYLNNIFLPEKINRCIFIYNFLWIFREIIKWERLQFYISYTKNPNTTNKQAAWGQWRFFPLPLPFSSLSVI